MSNIDYETKRKYGLVIGLLSIFDENVISEEEYDLIKDKDINRESDFKYLSDAVLRPWFLENPFDKRERIIQSIDFVIDKGSKEVDEIFSSICFVFKDKIENKTLFLTRVKGFIKNYMSDDKSINNS